jgi:UDP-N-acetylglucosamine 4,6-dehydratase
VDMVLYALDNAWGGELFVPKIPSYKITDVAMAIAPDCEHRIVGIRPGEKIHEEMITTSDSFSSYDLGNYYTILPQVPVWKMADFLDHYKPIAVTPGFTYNSGQNNEWLTVENIRSLIKLHVDSDFSI